MQIMYDFIWSMAYQRKFSNVFLEGKNILIIVANQEILVD